MDSETGRVRIAPELIEALVRQRYDHGVRELATLLWRCIAKSPGPWIVAPEALSGEPVRETPSADPDDLDPEAVRAALEEHDWVVARAWRALGLGSRHVLHRWMRKHGIERPE